MGTNRVVIISFSEDGDPPSVQEMEGKEFLEMLDAGDYGESPKCAEPGEKIDTDRFCGLIVIKGEIVKPKAIEVAKRYEL
jgi:hypothetical protein